MQNSVSSKANRWTLVEQKKGKQKVAESSDVTAEEVFNSNIDQVSSIYSGLVNHITDQTHQVDENDTVAIFGKLAEFALGTMSTLLERKVEEKNDSKDYKETILDFNRSIEMSSGRISDINACMGILCTAHTNLLERKIEYIANMKEFLEKHEDIKERRNKHPKRTEVLDVEKTNETPVSSVDAQRSYKDVVGSKSSELVVTRTKPILHPAEVVQNAYTGVTHIPVPFSPDMKHIGINTLTYIESHEVFMIKIGGTTYTAGPGNFVSRKKPNERVLHAKRCNNAYPCRFRNCSYYHDPAIGYSDNYHRLRNFNMSHIIRIIENIKDPTSLGVDIVRELVQIGGILMIKAAEIQAVRGY